MSRTAAETVRTARTRAGISQSALARRARLAQSTISRIEHGDLDPTWSTMQTLLDATGWRAVPEQTAAADLIPAATITREIARHLRRRDEEAAIRDLTEAIGRLLNFARSGGTIPQWAIERPKPTGDRTWDTFIATAFAYALERAGQRPLEWMTDVPPLAHETVPGDDPSPEFRAWLRARTPEIFRSKNILSRPADWEIA